MSHPRPSVPTPRAGQDSAPVSFLGARRTGARTATRGPALAGGALLALVAYVPLLATAPGRVGEDTKAYLYLDPGRLLAGAPYMWDPNTGFGTVTHQNIGYLWPMGPWYWAFHAAGVATWVAQRLWTGSLLFLAGLGVVFLMRTLGWERRPALLAALAYELSPYVMLYEARTSAILLPWAGLPWMLALTVRAVRHGGWRYPALFALVVPLVGSVNATSLLYAGLAPVMWLPFAVWVTRETTLRRAVSVALRIGALSLATSLWWIAGLATQGAYGIDVLRYTETVRAVARASVPYEVLRGLGNWYFYGRDRVSPWVQPATAYTQHIWLIAVSFAVPVLALGGAAVARWRYRAYFATLVVLGAVIAVGVHPYNHPSPLGAVLKSVANSSSAGLAMRTSVRAVPLVVLGTAVLLAAGAEALIARAPALRLAAVVAVVALVASDIPALWTGGFVEPNLDHPQRVPGYWLGAARQLDDAGPSMRVLELPGADFSYYRWGVTVDPVTPGLLHRPLGGRELTPFGSPPSADFMQALDRRLQEGVLEPQAIAPVARLMGVGTVLLRNDLQYERFRTPRPRLVWRLLDPPPPGLGAPAPFGPAMTAAPLVSLVDELTLGTPRDAPAPPSLAAFPVQAPVPIARAERAERPLLVAGDAEGVVEAGAAGLLDGTGPVIFAASGAADPALVTGALDLGADIVLTDTNRRRGRRWGTVRENYGYTERAGERPLVQDPSDARLPVFPRSTDEDRTVTEQRGLASVMATDYGDPVAYAPGSRPALAVDGDPSTAWTVGAFDDPRAQHLDVALAHPVTTDRVTLVQPLSPPNERYVTRATLRFDHGPSVPVTLGPSSRVATGQTVTFPGRTFQRLSVVIDATNYGPRADFSGVSGVGFAEVRIGAERVDEVVRLPTRPLSSLAGAASLDHRLVVLLSRSRANPGEPYKRDEETAMSRSFTLPAGRSFSLAGTARLSDTAPDPVLDAATGQPGLAQGAAVATASTRIGGDLRAGAQAAFDGDPTTAWSPTIEDAAGQPWVEVSAPAPVMFDHLDLAVVADGRHSVPARLGLEVDGRAVRTLEVPAVADGPDQGATVAVPLRFPPVTGRVVRVVVEAVRPVRTINYFSRTAQVLPPGLAEVGVPGVRVPPPPPFPARCRRDLLEVDGRPLPLLVSAPTGGDPRDPSRVPLSLRTCDGAPLALGPGSHLLQAIPGRVSGFDLDRLTLASDRGGGPVAVDAGGTPAPGGAGRTDGAPRVRVVGKTRTSARVHVDLVGSAVAGDAPFWLVLGQSHNDGWRAEVTAVQGPAGRTPGPAPALGRPKLIDGFANGWLVRAPQGATALDLRMTWTPQRRVWAALAGSGLAVMVCLVLVARRRRGVPAPGAVPGPGAAPAWAPGLPGAPRPPARRRVAAVAAAVALGSLVVAPWAGVVSAVAVFAALRWPRARTALALAPAALLSVAALYMAQLQLRYGFPLKLSWPDNFEAVTPVAWLAVLTLAAGVLVELALTRERSSGRRPG